MTSPYRQHLWRKTLKRNRSERKPPRKKELKAESMMKKGTSLATTSPRPASWRTMIRSLTGTVSISTLPRRFSGACLCSTTRAWTFGATAYPPSSSSFSSWPSIWLSTEKACAGTFTNIIRDCSTDSTTTCTLLTTYHSSQNTTSFPKKGDKRLRA